jgi:uncharacterized protein (TIGR03663 family)
LSHQNKYLILFLIILFAGGFVRFIRPELRPMHSDEAVNAHKLGILLESGSYHYDKSEYHGPVLYYATLISAWLKGQGTYSSLDESTLRQVTAFFSLLLLVLLLLLRKQLKWELVLVISALMAVAPGLVFYGRYYIHESLLTFFSYASIISAYRYLADKKVFWLVLAGACLGFMHTTKETCVINLAGGILALFIVTFLHRGKNRSPGRSKIHVPVKHLLIIFFSAAVISVLFFSSFFSNPQGIIDSVSTYALYLNRAGLDDAHIHPWHYYLSLLLFSGKIDGFSGTEIWVLITSMAGFVFLLLKRNRERAENLILFIGLYSLILFLIYSAMPYKTPWNLLQFYPGFLFLSGYGIIRFFHLRSGKLIRWGLLTILILGGIHWVWTGMQLNFRYYAEPGNPYVYAHTGTDIPEIAREIEIIGSVHPDAYEMPVEVVFPDNDYWPLPWYLRKFSNVGFFSEMDFTVPAAPLILIHPSIEKDLIRKLYEIPGPGERYLYTPLYDTYHELRPEVEIRTYLRKDVWDLYQFLQDSP